MGLMAHDFDQIDVFSSDPFGGNPLAVVHAADDLDDVTMAAFARWTNLSETTFLLRPTDPAADYRVRIWTPSGELPFAGHPTLGSCRAWLERGGVPRGERIVQECGVGLVEIRRDGERLAFAAPPLLKSGEVAPAEREAVLAALGVDALAVEWIDNGPGWVGVLVASADDVLALAPDWSRGTHKVAVLGTCADPEAAGADVEVRCFFDGFEDPVTGSANAGLALWLTGDGVLPENYVASQGTALGRTGRVFIDRDTDATWVGGHTRPTISGVLG